MFTFGDAHFHGSTGNRHVASPVVGLAGDVDRRRLLARDAERQRLQLRRREEQGQRRAHRCRATAMISADHEHARARRLPPARAAEAARSSPRRSASARPAPRSSALQTRLLGLGFWLPGVTGSFDSLTAAGGVRVPEVDGPAPHRRGRHRSPTTKFSTADAARAALHERLRDRDRQDPPGADRGEQRPRRVDVQRVDAAPTTRTCSTASQYTAHTPEGDVPRSSARSTASTRARSASSTGRSTSRTSGIAVHGYTDGAAVPGVARLRPGLERRDRLHVGQQHPARSAPRSGSTSSRSGDRSAIGTDRRAMTEAGRPDRYTPAPSGA